MLHNTIQFIDKILWNISNSLDTANACLQFVLTFWLGYQLPSPEHPNFPRKQNKIYVKTRISMQNF